LDDSIAVGGDRDYPFSSWKILWYYYRVKRKKRKEKKEKEDGQEKREWQRVEREWGLQAVEGVERKAAAAQQHQIMQCRSETNP
jgi:hypothetical protein